MNYTALFAITILVSAVAVRLHIPLWIVIFLLSVTTVALSLALFPKRSLLAPLAITLLLAVALLIPLPLPANWALLLRLGISVAGWASLVALSMKVLKT